jgi:predicted CopG family antitoxin
MSHKIRYKSIKVGTNTYEKLQNLGNLGDTFDKVIARLIIGNEAEQRTETLEKNRSVVI